MDFVSSLAPKLVFASSLTVWQKGTCVSPCSLALGLEFSSKFLELEEAVEGVSVFYELEEEIHPKRSV